MTVALIGEDVIEKSVPEPVRGTKCGLPAALVMMVRVPARLPTAVGRKPTLIVQLLPPAMLPPQVFVCAKSPLVPIPLMANVPLPVAERVTV